VYPHLNTDKGWVVLGCVYSTDCLTVTCPNSVTPTICTAKERFCPICHMVVEYMRGITWPSVRRQYQRTLSDDIWAQTVGFIWRCYMTMVSYHNVAR